MTSHGIYICKKRRCSLHCPPPHIHRTPFINSSIPIHSFALTCSSTYPFTSTHPFIPSSPQSTLTTFRFWTVVDTPEPAPKIDTEMKGGYSQIMTAWSSTLQEDLLGNESNLTGPASPSRLLFIQALSYPMWASASCGSPGEE